MDSIDMFRVARQIEWQTKRADALGITNTFNTDEWVGILMASEGRCKYCNKLVGMNYLIVEHAIPLAKGGGHVKENIVAACERCNSRKGTRSSPYVERIEVQRLSDDEVVVYLGARGIRLFDCEVETLVDRLTRA